MINTSANVNYQMHDHIHKPVDDVDAESDDSTKTVDFSFEEFKSSLSKETRDKHADNLESKSTRRDNGEHPLPLKEIKINNEFSPIIISDDSD